MSDAAPGQAPRHAAVSDRVAAIERSVETIAAAVCLLDGDPATAELLDDALTRLHVLGCELAELQSSLDAQVAVQQEQQVAAASRGRSGAPLKLHIGSGAARTEGWVHVDVRDGDVAADIRRPLPFPSESVSHIYACHVLEHLRFPDETDAFLSECRRVLRRGGKIRVVVPDLGAYLRAHVDDDETFWTTRQQTFTWAAPVGTRLDQILRYAGTSHGPHDRFGHRHGYDAASLVALLSAAGLSPVRLSTYQGSTDAAFHLDHLSMVAAAEHRGRTLSLFAEGYHLF